MQLTVLWNRRLYLLDFYKLFVILCFFLLAEHIFIYVLLDPEFLTFSLDSGLTLNSFDSFSVVLLLYFLGWTWTRWVDIFCSFSAVSLCQSNIFQAFGVSFTQSQRMAKDNYRLIFLITILFSLLFIHIRSGCLRLFSDLENFIFSLKTTISN